MQNWIYEKHFSRKNLYVILKYDNNIKYYLSINKLCKDIKLSTKRFYKEMKSKNTFIFKNYQIYYTKKYIKLPS